MSNLQKVFPALSDHNLLINLDKSFCFTAQDDIDCFFDESEEIIKEITKGNYLGYVYSVSDFKSVIEELHEDGSSIITYKFGTISKALNKLKQIVISTLVLNDFEPRVYPDIVMNDYKFCEFTLEILISDSDIEELVLKNYIETLNEMDDDESVDINDEIESFNSDDFELTDQPLESPEDIKPINELLVIPEENEPVNELLVIPEKNKPVNEFLVLPEKNKPIHELLVLPEEIEVSTEPEEIVKDSKDKIEESIKINNDTNEVKNDKEEVITSEESEKLTLEKLKLLKKPDLIGVAETLKIFRSEGKSIRSLNKPEIIECILNALTTEKK